MGAQTDEKAVADDGIRWLAAEKDYALALHDGKLISRNPKGGKLSTVPAWLKKTELAEQLLELRDWLKEHRQQCFDTADQWMLRSLPVPKDVLIAIWADPAWREALTNAVVASVKKDEIDQSASGFLRDVDAKKGVGVIDLDGETQWLKVDAIAIAHPILLEELDDFRELTVELGFEQSLDQLFRQTWKPTDEHREGSAVSDFSGGEFEQLNHVLGLCRRLGYRVSGGYACCPVWENGQMIEARFWVGSDYPEGETYTSDLVFTDDEEKSLAIKDVTPVAFSEGMRMAAAIYAKRKVKEEDKED